MMTASCRGAKHIGCSTSADFAMQQSESSVVEAIGKSSNSSNETVIARIETNETTTTTTTNKDLEKDHLNNTNNNNSSNYSNNSNSLPDEVTTMTTTVEDISTTTTSDKTTPNNHECNNKRGRLKSLLQYTAHHLNPFQHENNNPISDKGSQHQTICSVVVDENNNQAQSEQDSQIKTHNNKQHKHRSYLGLIGLGHHLQRYFSHHRCSQVSELNQKSSTNNLTTTRSAPVTPIKWRPLEGAEIRANGISQQQLVADSGSRTDFSTKQTAAILQQANLPLAAECANNNCSGSSNKASPSVTISNNQTVTKPSVRFVDTGKVEDTHSTNLMKADQKQTKADSESEDEADATTNLVAKLFKLPNFNGDSIKLNEEGESPMNSDKFRQYGYSLIDYISNYLDTIDKRRVTPLNIEPGYLKTLIQPDAPAKGESFASIMHDFENHIMCGITHWQHPHFHAYFPAGNAYPSILADMLSDALGCVGFSWAASPAYTELEIIMLDWMGKMIGLPDEFLCLSGGRSGSGQESKGGGVIQGSASECVLVNLLAARHWAMEKLRKRYPNTQEGILLSKLIGYCSKEAHSCVEKAAMIGFIRMRALDTDEKHSLRGETLAQAMAMDQANGLEPFIVCATLGTTSCVSFDNLEELGEVCQRHDVWLHVDAAYAGSALICPEFKYLMKGIERATSFNMNPNKWMLINFDCSLMWVKDRFKLTRAFVVDPLYLQHSFSDQAIDYRHWGIPLSRRFRALKLWFVIRNYGVEGLQAYIRNHVKLAKLFEQLIREDARFSITNEVVLGLVCFRLVGSNALNQRLLSMINASGKLHMVPASLNGRYVIRFCVCDRNAQEADILYAYRCISDFATELFELIRAGKERIRAISQQNTIDVSSISLHKQQSASADCLNNMSGAAGEGGAGEDGQVTTTATGEQVNEAQQVALNKLQQLTSGGELQAMTPLSARNSPSAQLQNSQLSAAVAKSPLIKQASVLQQPAYEHQQLPATDEDLEQEIVLDSLATIDGYDYDLDDDDLLEPPLFNDEPDGQVSGAGVTNEPGSSQQQQQQPDETNEWRSPVARHWSSRAGRASRNQTLGGPASGLGEHEDEAKDEVFTLAERRQRMSLRYKREFFVRVVSDPRVYRASISGDINAHSSSCSLGGSQHHNQTSQVVATTTPATTTSVPSVEPSSSEELTPK